MDKRLFDKSFSKVIWVLVEQSKLYKSKSKEFKLIKSALNQVLRKWTDVSIDMISEGVIELFQNKNVEQSPFDTLPTKLNFLGKNEKGKSFLVWEHTTPVNIFIEETLLKMESEEQVFMAMSDYSGICLVTRKEDDRLNEKGMRNKRNPNWETCYKQANIVPISRNEFNEKLIN